MSRLNYTNEDFLNLIITYGECNRVVDRTCRVFAEKYPNRPKPTRDILQRLLKNCVNSGAFKPKIEKSKPVLDNEEVETIVLAYFEAHPTKSVRDAEIELGFSFKTINRILHKNKWHSFKYHLVQNLKDTDLNARVDFCEWFLVMSQNDENFTKNVIWTDEAKFSKNGLFNRHNSHYWAKDNPHVTWERNFQDSWSFNVFCAVKHERILCLFFYDENLNSEGYINILRNVVGISIHNLRNEEAESAWYQMDGAPAHNSRQVGKLMDTMFTDRWIANNGPFRYPPRSPDLTPLDYFIWGYVKERVYSMPVTSKENMKGRVRCAFESLSSNEIQRATSTNIIKRVIACLSLNGGIFEHLLT